jgi:DNA-binding transcriptional LysR family regulator
LDRLTSMQVFLEVVQRGSFRAAADALQLSPTMVGKHIAALEAQLGVRLLNRTTRRQALTDAGRLWLDDSRAILADLADAEAAVSDLRGRPRGLLRIDAPVTFGVHDLTPALVDFMAQNPEIEIDLRLNNRIVDLIGEGVDVVFRIGPLTDSSLVARPLRPYRMMLAAAPAYLDKAGDPSQPDDLAGHDCLGFAYWSRRSVWTLSRDGQTRSVAVRSRFLTDNGEALRKAALSGGGVIMQPETLIREDLENGRLIRVLPDWSAPSRAMHVLYPADRRPAAKVQAFLAFVTQRFR